MKEYEVQVHDRDGIIRQVRLIRASSPALAIVGNPHPYRIGQCTVHCYRMRRHRRSTLELVEVVDSGPDDDGLAGSASRVGRTRRSAARLRAAPSLV